jgi:uncharacterized protein (TIGR00725 family)
MGSSTSEHEVRANAVGDLLATLGVNLLTGGGPGVMKAVSRAFTRHRRDHGICIGIIPCASEADRANPKPGYPNEFVELAIYTHLPLSGEQGTHDLSRNHINVLSCAAVIVFPGGSGTASEITLAARYRKPVIVYAPQDEPEISSPAVQRVDRIDDVAHFLRKYIYVSP